MSGSRSITAVNARITSFYHASGRQPNLLGLDHLKLTFKFQGRNFRRAHVAGDVIHTDLDCSPRAFGADLAR